MLKTKLFSILLCCILAGCATVNPMAVDKKTAAIDTSKKSVVLLALDVSRDDNSRYVPKPFVVHIEKPGARDKADRQNFKLREEDKLQLENGDSVYLVRMALAPGEYRLMAVTGNANAFPFNGIFQVPMLLDFNVAPSAISYMGQVTAKLRPRVGEEFRAGPVIPLLDQAVTGVSGGTFDVSVTEAPEKLSLFRTTYKALANSSIETETLPAFDRAAAQRWWAGTKDAD